MEVKICNKKCQQIVFSPFYNVPFEKKFAECSMKDTDNLIPFLAKHTYFT